MDVIINNFPVASTGVLWISDETPFHLSDL